MINVEQDTLYLFTGSEEPVIRTRINRLIDELSKTPSDVIRYDMDLTSFKKVISNKEILIHNPTLTNK